MDEERTIPLEQIAQVVSTCVACPLCTGRTNTVPGVGPSDAKIMLLGEGPGEQEDLSGNPFVGQAGQYLNGLLVKAGLPRESVFITNVVKCRPPLNRVPALEEVRRCYMHLYQQIRTLKPKVIVALGKTPSSFLYGADFKIMKRRGETWDWGSITVVFTLHPSYLMRTQDPAVDALVIGDLQKAMQLASR